jgi:hypothetical protein
MIRCDRCARRLPTEFIKQVRYDGAVHTFCWPCSYRWAMEVGITLSPTIWADGGVTR